MSWVKLDDGFYDHPKVMAAGNEAVGVYVRALSYCGKQLTNGFVPASMLDVLAGSRVRVLTQRLVAARLFEPTDGGVLVHDYLEINDSRERVLERRETERRKKASQRDGGSRARGVSRDVSPGDTLGESRDVSRRSEAETESDAPALTSGSARAPAAEPPPAEPSGLRRGPVCGLPEDWTPTARELEQLTAHGCWDAAVCSREWGLYWASRAHDRGTWTDRWDLRFQKLCLEHAQRPRACGFAPGKAKPKPAPVAPVRDFTGMTAEQLLAEQLAEDAAFQAAMAQRDATRAATAGGGA